LPIAAILDVLVPSKRGGILMRKRVIVFMVFLSLVLPVIADEGDNNASSTFLLTFDTAKPEPVSSFSWGVANVTGPVGGGGGAGKTEFQNFTFTKPLSALSKTLFNACVKGEHIKQVVLTVRKKKGSTQDFLVITMKDVIVTSYQVGGTNVPTETVSLSYQTADYILIGL
jgi:type VI protein secretion system component Hcp